MTFKITTNPYNIMYICLIYILKVHIPKYISENTEGEEESLLWE